ncbi:acyl-CoA dehydrogenase family protein [Chelatococcus reniformis]|nr:acyl-CoA dehydrogenase family protein [Chelatococcus reniformis]
MTSLSEEQIAFQDVINRAIVETSPVERAQKLDAAKTFDAELYRVLGELGVLGLGVAEEDGGSGGTNIEQVVALRALANRATSMAVFCVVQFLVTRLLKDNATAEQKRAFLAPLAAGRQKASFCLTEAGGGTDILRAMKTTARADGGDYVINGAKMWISGATTSDFYVVLARTAPGKTDGVSMFLVPSRAAGITAREIDTFAINGYDTCQVFFDDVRVPAANLIGTEGRGFRQVLATLNSERINAAAVAIGIAQGAMEVAADYARERQAFGKSLAELQAVQHKLANVATTVELAWTFLLATAVRDDNGEPVDVASSMAKLAASNAAKLSADVGMEILASAAFDTASPMQRYYRDHRLYSFAPLNDEMCRNLIAERYFGFGRGF